MIGFCMTGSFCCFEKTLKVLRELSCEYEILPIMSYNAYNFDTKFGKSQYFIDEIEKICNKSIIHTIQSAEPVGPDIVLESLVVCPCTGNTLSKIANGITDTPATMAVKAQLRNERPVVIALSTNDGLSGSAPNIARLLNKKNVFFVPFSQDAPEKKPRSLVAKFELVSDALKASFEGRQLQPMIGYP